MAPFFKNILLLVVAFFFLCFQCDDHVNCTEEFRFINIEVVGDPLDDFYTLRKSTGDTLRLSNVFPDSKYAVLDDRYHPQIKNRVEDFTFIGIINDSVVVSEPFVISGDDCHIDKVKGVNTVTL